MAAEPIDTVAIRLVADASSLLEDADAAVDKVVEKGEEAGLGFAEGFIESAAKAGQAVRELAELTNISFRDAAQAFQAGHTPFEGLDVDQLVIFAETLDKMGISLEKTADDFDLTNDKLDLFANLLPPSIKAIDETKSSLERVNEIIEEMAVAVEEENIPAVEALLEEMIELSAEADVSTEAIEEFNKALADQQSEAVLIEEQVKKVVDAYRELGIAIPDALKREQIRAHIRALKEHEDQFSDVAKEANSFTDSLIEQGKKMRDANQEGGFLNLIFNDLSKGLTGLAKNAIAAFGAFQILKTVFNEIKQATQFALDFTDVTSDLAKAVRVNTVAGDENTHTFRQWQQIAEEIARETAVELLGATETVTLALRELGAGTELSDSQIQDLLITGSKFADLYGQQLPGAIRQATAFINRGYAEALNNLGLELGKQAQNQKTFELGLGSNIDKLSESQQEFVRYVLLLEQMAERTDALGDETDTFSKRLEDVADQTEKAALTLGNLFAPLALLLKEEMADVKEGFAALIGIIVLSFSSGIAQILGNIIAFGAGVKFVLDNIGKAGFFKKMEELPALVAKAAQEATFQILQFQVEQMTGATDEYAQSAQGAAGATQDFGDAVEATQQQIQAFIQEAQKFDEGMKKIEQRLEDALDDITRRFNERRANAELDLQRDLADIDEKSAIDRMMTVRQFMIDEIRLREDHAKDIRQLEERFLLDLEDAVRDRDARRVLSLQRRFNLEKKRREEDFGLRNKRLREDFREELRLIEYQRQRRRAERIQAFNEEMADLAAQQLIREEEAKLRADRAERDLLAQIRARLEAMAGETAEQTEIIKEQLDKLNEALTAEFGPEGVWTLFYKSAVKTVQDAATGVAHAGSALVSEMDSQTKAMLVRLRIMERAAARARSAAQALRGAPGDGAIALPPEIGSRRQRGGTVFATSPTNFLAGDGRPERIDITPLSAGTGKPSAGFRGGGDKIRIVLDVNTSEMLVVEVADQTMSEMADVFVNINQRGFQGGRGA